MSGKFLPEGSGGGNDEPFYLQTKFLEGLAVVAAFVPLVGLVLSVLIHQKSQRMEWRREEIDAYAASVRAKVKHDTDNILAETQAQVDKIFAEANGRVVEADERANAIIAAANDRSAEIISAANAEAEKILSEAQAKLAELEHKIANREEVVAQIVAEGTWKARERNSAAQRELERIQAEIDKREFYLNEVERIKQNLESLQKKSATLAEKIDSQMRVRKAVNAAVRKYLTGFRYLGEYTINLTPEVVRDAEWLAPSVMLKLHSMDYKDLRRLFRANEKLIEDTLTRYEERYTTKTNRAIYRLMVIALRAELQNILYTLTSSKLNDALGKVRDVTNKYLNIAREGNQTISSTLATFIGELEVLFADAVKIEYEYFVKREVARQEQLELRAKMREEAEEQRRLKEQQEQMEREETKYNAEIEKLLEQARSVGEAKNQALMDKVRALELQLADLSAKKDEIINLQNGKAGYVYIISNLGSFGDDVFKVGMTRRLNPQERIDELGSASVPFKFDVHSFIFSEDAVKLESDLHAALNSRRLNKVNLRKEFFKIPIGELERLVEQFDPAAEFNRTMQAEQYYQSLSAAEG